MIEKAKPLLDKLRRENLRIKDDLYRGAKNKKEKVSFTAEWCSTRAAGLAGFCVPEVVLSTYPQAYATTSIEISQALLDRLRDVRLGFDLGQKVGIVGDCQRVQFDRLQEVR